MHFSANAEMLVSNRAAYSWAAFFIWQNAIAVLYCVENNPNLYRMKVFFEALNAYPITAAALGLFIIILVVVILFGVWMIRHDEYEP